MSDVNDCDSVSEVKPTGLWMDWIGRLMLNGRSIPPLTHVNNLEFMPDKIRLFLPNSISNPSAIPGFSTFKIHPESYCLFSTHQPE